MPLTAFKNSVWFKSCDFLKNSEMGWILLPSSSSSSSSNALIFFEFYPSDHENFWYEASTYPWIHIRAGIILNFLFFRQKLRFYSLTRLVFFLGECPIWGPGKASCGLLQAPTVIIPAPTCSSHEYLHAFLDFFRNSKYFSRKWLLKIAFSAIDLYFFLGQMPYMRTLQSFVGHNGLDYCGKGFDHPWLLELLLIIPPRHWSLTSWWDTRLILKKQSRSH